MYWMRRRLCRGTARLFQALARLSHVPRTRSSQHNYREFGCELRGQSSSIITDLLAAFDRSCCTIGRTSESGGTSRGSRSGTALASTRPPRVLPEFPP